MDLLSFIKKNLDNIREFLMENYGVNVEFVNTSDFKEGDNFVIYYPYEMRIDENYRYTKKILKENDIIYIPKPFYIDLDVGDIIYPVGRISGYEIPRENLNKLKVYIEKEIIREFGDFLNLKLKKEEEIHEVSRKLGSIGYANPLEAYLIANSSKNPLSNPFKLSRLNNELEMLYEVLKNKYSLKELEELGYKNLAKILERKNYKEDVSIMSFLEKR